MEITNTVYRGAISRFGNSQGIRIAQDILKQANLYEDFDKVAGGKIMVDLIVSPDSITIKRATKEEKERSQEKQKRACLEFLKSLKSFGYDNSLPENFDELYSYVKGLNIETE